MFFYCLHRIWGLFTWIKLILITEPSTESKTVKGDSRHSEKKPSHVTQPKGQIEEENFEYEGGLFL